MSGGHDAYVGGSYLATRQATGRICGEIRPTLVLFLSFSSAVGFRLLPPSSVGIRFGSHLVRVCDGNMSGGHDDAVGRAYLETQHAMGQICGENRPILVLLMSFFRFRHLPPAFVCFRNLPSASVSGSIWSVRLMEKWMGP